MPAASKRSAAMPRKLANWLKISVQNAEPRRPSWASRRSGPSEWMWCPKRSVPNHWVVKFSPCRVRRCQHWGYGEIWSSGRFRV